MSAVRIVEAGRHFEGALVRRFFAESASVPGAWYRIDVIPGESATCSCPRGVVLATTTDPQAKLCRHLAAVVDRLFSEVKYGAPV